MKNKLFFKKISSDIIRIYTNDDKKNIYFEM